MPHDQNIGRLCDLGAQQCGVDTRAHPRPLLQALAATAEVFHLGAAAQCDLIASALKSQIKRLSRAGLTFGQCAGTGVNAHGHGNRHVVVAESDIAHGVKNFKLAPDTFLQLFL